MLILHKPSMMSCREQWQNIPRSIWDTRAIKFHHFLYSGSDVTLIWQSYFDEHLVHLVRAHSGEKSDVYTLFHFMVAKDEQLPITKFVELDLNFMGLILPKVGILVTRDPNQLLDPKHQMRLPGVVGWNLVHLAFKEFIKLYGTAVFDSFDCPSGVSPLLFSQLCVYYHTDYTDIRHTHCPQKHLWTWSTL